VPDPLSANVIVCADVLLESATDLLSAIRMMTVITVPPGNSCAHFYSVVFISSVPGDYEQHKVQMTMNTLDGQTVASAKEYQFVYGYRINPAGNGGFTLRTEFNVDVAKLQGLGTYWIWAHVDGKPVAKTPLMLRR